MASRLTSYNVAEKNRFGRGLTESSGHLTRDR
jgi:hypothetical protein